MSSFDEEKGLVGKVLRAVESDTYDLAGYNEIRCCELIEKAFMKPLESCNEMIKFTFIIGGGKLVRSRYDESMSKWIVSSLKSIDFVEDRSAACDYNSQGTFKQQHDTGQNLKTIIIFPRVACANKKDDVNDNGNEDQGNDDAEMNHQEKAIMDADFSTFCEIIDSRTKSWMQRKRALKVLQEGISKFEEIEAKMFRGEKLSQSEQSVYDNSSGCDAEKVSWLQGEIKTMVDKGQLTLSEKQQL